MYVIHEHEISRPGPWFHDHEAPIQMDGSVREWTCTVVTRIADW